jgi:hypothetical protein
MEAIHFKSSKGIQVLNPYKSFELAYHELDNKKEESWVTETRLTAKAHNLTPVQETELVEYVRGLRIN